MTIERSCVSGAVSAISPGLEVGCADRHHLNIILILIDCVSERQFTHAVKGGYAGNLTALTHDSKAVPYPPGPRDPYEHVRRFLSFAAWA
jgi:hypothetical protein